MTLHPLRRIALAGAGIAVAGIIARTPIADALVVRGDEFLYKGKPALALRYYRRALWLDPRDGTAVDRLSFVATMSGDRGRMIDAVGIATEYLAGDPQDDRVRLDRAMAYRRLGRPDRALADFATVGRRTKDARALTFAGFAAADAGEPQRARVFWKAALALAPGFPAARHALDRVEQRR